MSLTQFIDISLAQSTMAKITAIRKSKESTYSPASDYWKPLRDGIKKMHQEGLDLTFLDSIPNAVDPRRRQNYVEMIKQYKLFCRGREISWFEPPSSYWSEEGLFVRSTPELGLHINGKPYLVKLSFKERSEKMDKRGVQTTLTLVRQSTYERELDAVRSVLNIRKARLFEPQYPIDDRAVLALTAEAQQIVYLWDKV